MYDKELKAAIKAARLAGKAIMKFYNKKHKINYKSPDDPVTEADIESQKIIFSLLKGFKHGMLSEESLNMKKRFKKEKVWIIDPLDGTKDFIDKTDEFAVSIGLAENGGPVLGVVYAPAIGAMYYAVKGGGAYMKKGKNKLKKIKVSKIEDFNKAKVFVSRYHVQEKEIKLFKKLKVKNIISHGGLLKACKIAEGVGEININTSDKTNEWDTCASDIILKEAGGKFTDMNGEEIKYNKENPANQNGYVATNAIFHDQLIKELK